MIVATWNVNSVKIRVENTLAWLKERDPDIVCLQELKCVDEAFPREAFESAGYNNQYNSGFMVMTLALQFVRASWAPFVFIGVYVLILIALLDGFLAWRRIKARLRDRFPNENLRGLGGYAAMRMMQMRRLRMPKPQVARGEHPA